MSSSANRTSKPTWPGCHPGAHRGAGVCSQLASCGWGVNLFEGVSQPRPGPEEVTLMRSSLPSRGLFRNHAAESPRRRGSMRIIKIAIC